MKPCTEIYVYEIAPEQLGDFLALKDELITATENIPGLLESATFQSAQQDNLFIDRMRWESAEAAMEGGKTFESLPVAARFMSMMTAPPMVGGRFNLVAGS